MFKPRKLKPIKIGFDDQKVAFFPRSVSQAEYDDVELALSEAKAETVDKYQRIFEIKRTAIADWSAEMPQEIVKEKGENKLVPIGEKSESFGDAINRFFAHRTVENERVINQAYTAYVSMQQPEIDFL